VPTTYRRHAPVHTRRSTHRLVSRPSSSGSTTEGTGGSTPAGECSKLMAAATAEVAYRPGHCAWCAQPLERDTSSQEIRQEVIAPAGVVTIHSWLGRSCQPALADGGRVSRELVIRLTRCYAATPSALASAGDDGSSL
jgi:hypothetical protein